MPLPTYEAFMLPILEAIADGNEARLSEIRTRVTDAEGLTAEDLALRLPSGGPMFGNRIAWALLGITKAGLVERVRRGVYRLTPDGAELLASGPSRVDDRILAKYPAFVEWKKQVALGPKQPLPDESGPTEGSPAGGTPEESLESAVSALRRTLEVELLDRVRQADPSFLERVVVDLLIAMGYGGGDASMGRVTGRSGDGGIDGKIREDALGLDEVYVQAKKYGPGNSVGEGDLRNFAGAIDAAGTTKGVFVTTARFTQAASDYVARSPKRIVLIDGEMLARMMVEHDIGVRARVRYSIKQLDENYFDQEGE